MGIKIKTIKKGSKKHLTVDIEVEDTHSYLLENGAVSHNSVILGTASGIHPEHAEQYFRLMQINKNSEIGRWLEENAFPDLIEDSVWSSTDSDYVIYIPIKNDPGALFKDQMVGIAHLEKIKFVQEHWISEGKHIDRCFNKGVMNNVSCTVIIDNYDEIAKYMFENQDYFTAVSFLSNTGDKDYPQMPFTSIKDSAELLEFYGDGVIFASGLIVDGLQYFDNNLWEACEHILDRTKKVSGTRTDILLKTDWLRRAKQFARNNFKNNLETTVYCLKDVHLWHKWCKINRNLKRINFEEILLEPKYNDVSDYAAQSCSGGACEIERI
jgi:ribonucleoside-triphosphate reductase